MLRPGSSTLQAQPGTLGAHVDAAEAAELGLDSSVPPSGGERLRFTPPGSTAASDSRGFGLLAKHPSVVSGNQPRQTLLSPPVRPGEGLGGYLDENLLPPGPDAAELSRRLRAERNLHLQAHLSLGEPLLTELRNAEAERVQALREEADEAARIAAEREA